MIPPPEVVRLGTPVAKSEQGERSRSGRSGQSGSFWIGRAACATGLFDLAIDSKLRGCDLVKLEIGTLVTGMTAAPGRW